MTLKWLQNNNINEFILGEKVAQNDTITRENLLRLNVARFAKTSSIENCDILWMALTL